MPNATPGREPILRPEAFVGRTLKLVYWGPGLSGKTTNVRWLHRRMRPELRSRLITLDTPGERTLYFDCLPLDLQGSAGQVRLKLYTVPGQPRFALTRRLVMQGADALVFVWDSRSRRLRANLRSLFEAREAVEGSGAAWTTLPRICQLNKQDLSPLTPRGEINLLLDRLGEHGPRVAAVAIDGRGVIETLTVAARLALGLPARREERLLRA